MYEVDMKAGLCQCFKGFLKGHCKHKEAVSLIYKLHNFYALPQQNEKMRSFYHFLATGTQKYIAWFRPINGENSFPELLRKTLQACMRMLVTSCMTKLVKMKPFKLSLTDQTPWIWSEHPWKTFERKNNTSLAAPGALAQPQQHGTAYKIQNGR